MHVMDAVEDMNGLVHGPNWLVQNVMRWVHGAPLRVQTVSGVVDGLQRVNQIVKWADLDVFGTAQMAPRCQQGWARANHDTWARINQSPDFSAGIAVTLLVQTITNFASGEVVQFKTVATNGTDTLESAVQEITLA